MTATRARPEQLRLGRRTLTPTVPAVVLERASTFFSTAGAR